MQLLQPSYEHVNLCRNELWKCDLHRRDHLSVVCGSGRLWITREGHPEDELLESGGHLDVSGPGLVLVSGVSPESCVELAWRRD